MIFISFYNISLLFIRCMRKQPREKRVVNLDKTDYETIQKYCNHNALDLPKWLVKIALDKIEMDRFTNKRTLLTS